jgi:putative transposase
MEDLHILNMSAAPVPRPDPGQDGAYLPNGARAKAGLNTSIRDAGWGQFQALCAAKAESAGRTVVLVDPHFTSQRCSQCGAMVKKALSERWHSCDCGCELDRDHNAAINILLAWKTPTVPRDRRSPRLEPWGTLHTKHALTALHCWDLARASAQVPLAPRRARVPMERWSPRGAWA